MIKKERLSRKEREESDRLTKGTVEMLNKFHTYEGPSIGIYNRKALSKLNFRIKPMHLDTIEFKKSGEEILKAIVALTGKKEAEKVKLTEEILPLMKEWDISMEEARASGKSNVAYENMSNKISNSGPRAFSAGTPPNKQNAVKQMQADIDKIRATGYALVNLDEAIVELEMVKRNISPGAEYSLSFNDLGELEF